MRPNLLAAQAWMGNPSMDPKDWIALIKPSQAPEGLPIKLSHGDKDCKPVISELS